MLAVGDCVHAQLLALTLYGNASITGFLLIVVGRIDVHWDQEGHVLRFDALAKNR